MSKNALLLGILVFLTASCLITVKPVRATEDSWTTKAPMPTARRDVGLAVVKGKIYAIGAGMVATLLQTGNMTLQQTRGQLKRQCQPPDTALLSLHLKTKFTWWEETLMESSPPAPMRFMTQKQTVGRLKNPLQTCLRIVRVMILTLLTAKSTLWVGKVRPSVLGPLPTRTPFTTQQQIHGLRGRLCPLELPATRQWSLAIKYS